MDAEAQMNAIGHKLTYDHRRGYYLTLVDGKVAEAHLNLWDFIESLDDLWDRT